MITRTFEKLGELTQDAFLPMSELFDLAFTDVYGDTELNSMIACERWDDNTWLFEAYNDETSYRLYVYSNWSFEFYGNDLPLHFNQYPLYQKLFDWGFLSSNK